MATDTPTTGRDSDKFMLRLPDGMRERLKEVAKSNKRTLNAEIVARLEQTFSESSSDEALKALALRLAESELALAVTEVESETRLLNVYVAASTAIDAVNFNKQMGYECPLEPDDLHEVDSLLNDASILLDQRSKDDFLKALDAMKEANEKVNALKQKSAIPKRQLSQRARLKKN